MRLFYTLMIFLFLSNSFVHGIDASVSFATFKSAEQNYVEIYLTVIGQTVDYQVMNADSTAYQAKVEVILMFKQGEKIVKFDKYALNSPVTDKHLNFIDIKRYGLPDGDYTLEVNLKDLVDETNIRDLSSNLHMGFSGEGIQQSDIQLLSVVRQEDSASPFVKNGVYMEVLPFNFCDRNTSMLQFYNEIYGADIGLSDDFMVSYFIEKINGKGEGKSVLVGHKRHQPQAVNVVLGQMDISDLPSGNYRLRIEVRDRTKTLLSTKSILFERSNPFLEEVANLVEDFDLATSFAGKLTQQELRYSLKGIAPIVSNVDVERLNFIIAQDDLNKQREYLFNFWASQNANHPEKAYAAYMEVVKAVDAKYKSGFGYGFETDRGNIFLKYGKPDDVISVQDEPVAPPYEIWAYHRIPKTMETNVKFLFYNPNLAAGDYRLLHSTARAEISNPQWELELYKQAPDQIEGSDYLNGIKIKDGLNRQAARYFNEM